MGQKRYVILRGMMRFPALVLRWLATPALLLVFLALAAALWLNARRAGLDVGSLIHPLALAFSGAIALRLAAAEGLKRLGRDDPLEFIDTLEHELTHALIGYLTLTPPLSLSATLRSGGEVELKGSNPLAALAPYFLPLWCHVLLLVGFIARTGLQSAWNILLFFALGNFAYRLAKEYRWRQTDLHVYGFFFSTATVAVLLLLDLAVILHLRHVLSWGWVAEGLGRAAAAAVDLWTMAKGKA